MSLTKDMIALSIHEALDVPKSDASRLVEFVLEKVKDTIAKGEEVLISGFGKFWVREKNERRGRNPATGNRLTLEARRVVRFRCSSALQSRLNGKSPK